MDLTVLVTGGCGFIGTSLVNRLLAGDRYTTIRILDNFLEGTADDLALITEYSRAVPEKCTSMGGVVLIEGDIRDQRTAELCCRGADSIVHLAANTGVPPSVANPRMDMENNVIGTFNMLEAARAEGVEKFVFASSGAPAGTVAPPIHEELPPHPISPYGASKLAGEGYCSAYFHSYGVKTICLRFGNVYGPGSRKKSSVVAKFIRQALAGESCHIYGDGRQTRDFIYIDDLISAVELALTADLGGETFQIASGQERTVDEVVAIIAAVLREYDITMNIIHDRPRKGDVKRNFSDISKAREILGWRSAVDIKDGIQRTVDYFMELTG